MTRETRRVGRGEGAAIPTFFFNLQSSIFMRENKNFRYGIKFKLRLAAATVGQTLF